MLKGSFSFSLLLRIGKFLYEDVPFRWGLVAKLHPIPSQIGQCDPSGFRVWGPKP